MMEEQDYGVEYDVDAGVAEESAVRCELVTGAAGTGKTHEMRRRIAEDPEYGILSASTGIAAINLGATTINSVLKYFDTASLRENFLTGKLTTILHGIAKQYRNLIIDEVSMIDGQQLDYIVRATKQANGFRDVETPLGIIVVGDFCQLPPVKAKWAFEADCWPLFDANTTRLTKMWRQSDTEFLMALNALRTGNGDEAMRILSGAGVKFHNSLEMEFDGTTIVPKNDQVDRYNWESLSRVQGKKIEVRAQRWGKQRGDWKLVPETVEFKVGAYVMLLANKSEQGELVYANGDCGHIKDFDGTTFTVELVRNGQEVEVNRIVRANSYKDKPDGWYGETESENESDGNWYPKPHRTVGKDRKYVEGQVKFFPMRLAYASTVHKSQGLSLDRCQIDFRNAFFGSPAMLYVALSRCRTAEGLRLIGMPEMFAKRCKVDQKVLRWL